jgi:flagellum-specific peptidoglycan hydrolase FlgJ
MKTNYALEQYESPKQDVNVFNCFTRLVAAGSQLLVALKYQWYKFTNGSASAIKLGVLAIGVLAFLKYNSSASYRDPYAISSSQNALLGFSLAPAEPKTLRDAQVMNYVERYKKIAIEESRRYGIPASISMAQGIVESRCGESTLAEKNNNHFGIKCFSHNCSKGHCSNFTDDSHKDFFRKFDSAWESWREHSKLLALPRYKKLRAYGNDYESWAKGLSKLGYATDDTYAEKLIEVIEKYNLNKLDD